MKQIFSTIILLCVAICFYSCSISSLEPIEKPKEQESAESEVAVNGPQKMISNTNADSLNFDEVKVLIDNLGYNTETLTEYDDYYQIYSDVVFNKSDIIEALEQPRTLDQTRAEKLNQRSWRLAVDLSNVGTYYHDIRSAMMGWNNVNSSIDFGDKAERPNRYYIKILIGQNGGQTDKLCYVVPNPNPEENKPGKYLKFADIYINTAHEDWNAKVKNFNKIIQLFKHAFGHVIGLDHVEGSEDLSSIMRSEKDFIADPSVWHLISSEDSRKLREVYPLVTEPVLKYTLNSQPIEIGSDRRVKLVPGREYKFKLDCIHPWVVEPSYHYWTESPQDMITFSHKEGILTVKFNKVGESNFVIQVQDLLDEKNKQYNIVFYSAVEKPTFIYPDFASIAIGEYAWFKINLPEQGFDPKDVKYSITASESMFDGGSGRNVEIIQLQDKSTFDVKFKDYGAYTLTAKVEYGSYSSTFVCKLSKFYEPGRYAVTSSAINVEHAYKLPSMAYKPTGPNQISGKHPIIKFMDTPVLNHRVAFNILDYVERMIMHLPGRPDKHTFLIKTTPVTLNAGDSPKFVCPARYTMYHPDSTNYKYHYTILYAETGVSYPKSNLELISETHR